MALLVLEPRPVNAPCARARCFGISGDVRSVLSIWGLTEVVERIRISAALSVSAAVVGARCSAATFACERWEALAFTSGAITQAASTTLAVSMLVVESCVLPVNALVAICGVTTGRSVGPRERGSRGSVDPVTLDVGGGKTHGVRTFELSTVRSSETRFAAEQARGRILFVRTRRSLSHKVAQVRHVEGGIGSRDQR